jgi:hypothetical protein
MADIIINIVNEETKDIRRHISKKFEGKVVDIDVSEDLSEAVSKVKELAGSNSVRIHLTTAIYDGKFPINDAAVKKYIEDSLIEFETMNRNDIDAEDMKTELNNQREKLEKPGVADNVVRQSMFNDRLFEIVNALQLMDVHIKNITSAVNKSHTRIAKAAT